MTTSSTPSSDVGPTAHPLRAGSRAGVLLRCLIAAVGMMVCANALILPSFVPGLDRWASAESADDVTAVFLLVQFTTMAMPMFAGLLVLWGMTRIEKVGWRAYLGGASATESIRMLVAASVAAAAVTAVACGAAALTGFDADRGVAMNTAGEPLLLILAVGFFRAFLMQGVQEELWFRGFAFRGVTERPWLVLIVTTLVFTALHLVSQGGQESAGEFVLFLALPFGMGLWAGVERWCTGSVWPAVGVHGGIHMGLTVASIAGWPLGPAAWIALGIVLSVAALVRLGVVRPWQARNG